MSTDVATKKCKFCQTDIDAKASICPNCKKEQKKKFPVWAIILIVVVLLCGASASGAGKDNKSSGEKKGGFFSNLFTGAFLGTNGGKWSVGILIFLILLGVAWWIVAWKRNSSEEKPVKVVKMSEMKKK